MPTLQLSPGVEMHYTVDDYTDPWRTPETILMLHGNAEAGAAWYRWVPQLARDFRVVRPDMRGFGASTPMQRDFAWTFDQLIADYVQLMGTLGIERFHLVGAKLGGTVARAFAAREPDRVLTLTVIGTPRPDRPGGDKLPALLKEIEQGGVAAWAGKNMAGRLGSDFPAEGLAWWTKFMARTQLSTQLGFQRDIAYADISADIPKIRCPTLVITTEESGLATIEENRRWQSRIPDSELLVMPGNSYHVAASDPERCAQAMLDFIDRRHAGTRETAS
jgi:pimeloyl-ACP methyl ester carboxylesterase